MNKWGPIVLNYSIKFYSLKINNIINITEIYYNKLISLIVIEQIKETKYFIFLNKNIEKIYHRFTLVYSLSNVFLKHLKNKKVIQKIVCCFNKSCNFSNKMYSKKGIVNILKVSFEIINNYFQKGMLCLF